MKKIIAYILLIATFLFSVAFTSINNPEKDIIGTWKIDESLVASSVEKILERVKKTNPAQAKEFAKQQEALAEAVRITTLEFKENKDYILTTGFDNLPRKGSWKINTEDMLLVRTDSKGEITEDKILEINSSRFRIIKTSTKDTITYNKKK